MTIQIYLKYNSIFIATLFCSDTYVTCTIDVIVI